MRNQRRLADGFCGYPVHVEQQGVQLPIIRGQENRYMVAVISDVFGIITRGPSAKNHTVNNHTVNFEETVVIAVPSPVEMEVVVGIVAIAHKKAFIFDWVTVVYKVCHKSLCAVIDGPLRVQLALQHGFPKGIRIVCAYTYTIILADYVILDIMGAFLKYVGFVSEVIVEGGTYCRFKFPCV